MPSSTMRDERPHDLDEGTSSPASRDRVSCTSAIDADAAHRLLDGRLGLAATPSRRPCSRSSDEIVCRLFFTRWWISRIVASFDSSSRSRRRSSETSRSSTTAPVTAPWSSSGMQRISTVTSAPRSTSSVTGAPMAKAVRTTVVVEAELGEAQALGVGVDARCGAGPTRALGDVYSTRPAASRRITPSPTRGRLLGLGVLGVEGEVARWRSCGRSG